MLNGARGEYFKMAKLEKEYKWTNRLKKNLALIVLLPQPGNLILVCAIILEIALTLHTTDDLSEFSDNLLESL